MFNLQTYMTLCKIFTSSLTPGPFCVVAPLFLFNLVMKEIKVIAVNLNRSATS